MLSSREVYHLFIECYFPKLFLFSRAPRVTVPFLPCLAPASRLVITSLNSRWPPRSGFAAMVG